HGVAQVGGGVDGVPAEPPRDRPAASSGQLLDVQVWRHAAGVADLAEVLAPLDAGADREDEGLELVEVAPAGAGVAEEVRVVACACAEAGGLLEDDLAGLDGS